MKTFRVAYYPLSLLIPLLPIVVATPGKAQPITPANDGTGTTVNQNGNQFNIQGGTRSGRNLFHSFDQFNVNSGQSANFLTTPDTHNILGRVTGGNASIINGLIQVIGSNSNLLLMNPAGMIFGPNASLNLPASFSVTTATGIGFNSNNFWFQAMGTNDYSNLVGNPSGYRFNVSNPGAIVNEGNLSLNPGENLTLLGGTVINTGELSTAGGNVTIAAVEGGSTLRISQPGHLLSLDVSSSVGITEETNFTPLSLPELLTGGDETHATSISVNADGDVVLTDSNTLVADVPSTVITSGNIDVSIPPNPPYQGGNEGQINVLGDRVAITSGFPLSKGDGRGIEEGGNMKANSGSTLFKGGQGGSNIGGQINILGDRVAIIDANIHADGINGGGTVLIGGDFQGNGIVSNSQQTFVNNNSFISADAITNGDGGRVIIWSDGVTNFAGNISAKGGEFSGNGGFVEVSGKQQLIFDGNVNVSAAFGTPGTILLDPENITVGESENTENSETETVDNNSEVASTENTDSSTTENTENSETETVDNNSEVASAESTDSPTTENTENSETETVDNNSEVASAESTEENVDNSETTENTNSETEVTSTEIADNSETTETEIPIDPFAQDENSDVTISAENIGDLSGDIILFADNDITINEKIETNDSVELKAGRSININADIDTSMGNGNIDLLGNNDEMNIANRSDGAASINQLDGTTLNAGSGTINIELGNLGEIGDINLANLTTTGQVLVNANGGNITRVSDNSIINAGSAVFGTVGNGGIGSANAPLQLDVENLEAFTLSGSIFFDVLGDVNVGGVSEGLNGILTLAGGDIVLNSEGDVSLAENISTDPLIETGGDINLTAKNLVVNDGTQISASTLFAKRDAGSVDITVEDNIVLNGGSILSTIFSTAEGNAGNVNITTNSLIILNGGFIDNSNFGKGNAGIINITSEDIVFSGVSQSSGLSGVSRPSGVFSGLAPGVTGNAGGVNITTSSLIVSDGAQINALTGGIGDGGNINITADNIVLDGSSPFGEPSGTFSTVGGEAEGDGGDVNITTNSLTVQNGAQISTSTFGTGNGGNIDITAEDTVKLDGVSLILSRVQETGEGKAGDVNISADVVEVNNGAQINTSSLGKGDVGNINIVAEDKVVLNGVSPDNNSNFSAIFSSVGLEAEGEAANITITTGSLEVKGGAQIVGATLGKGDGGNINITAEDKVVFDGVSSNGLPSRLSSEVGAQAEGRGGDVSITSNSLEVTNGSQIAASTFGQGNAGMVNITAEDKVVFDGVSSDGTFSSGILSQVALGAEGNGGSVNIRAGSLEVTNGAQINSSTFSIGNAGTIEITAEDKVVFDGISPDGTFSSGILSQVALGAEGNAGDVTITARDLTVENGAQIAASTFGTGNAGSVEINATDTVVLDGGEAESFTG
ncbi:filamentous hemagglutinin N-terminal domain-containing protein, partial [Okeania sp. SIO1I7]|uniref:beta strand repeat-containing protein n=1 Tax=Okeania sp. SIO1I7 TaxID=2607772 RepID=UPI0025E5D3FD